MGRVASSQHTALKWFFTEALLRQGPEAEGVVNPSHHALLKSSREALSYIMGMRREHVPKLLDIICIYECDQIRRIMRGSKEHGPDDRVCSNGEGLHHGLARDR